MIYDAYFHDDFDGRASTAVILNFLKSRGDSIGHFAPLNFDIRTQWLKENFFALNRLVRGKRNPAIVSDFFYHPRAAFWFDHHATTFKKPLWRKKFRQTKQHVYDPAYKSCCHLVLDALGRNFGWKPPKHLAELARWLDIIDGARYKSAKQTIDMKEPALQIDRIIDRENLRDLNKTFIDWLAFLPMREIVKIPEVRKAIAENARETKKGLRFVRAHLQIFGNVTFIYYPLSSMPKLRFAPFYLYPKSVYGMRLSGGRGEYHLSVGVNPWRTRENKLHLGKLLNARYGGGGHTGVGAAEFKTKKAAEKALRELIELLQ